MSALRISTPGRPTRFVILSDPYWALTQRQRHIVDVVRGHQGNRSRAARELGITFQSVQAALRLAQAAGCRVPPALRGGAARGPDLRPRKGLRPPCGALMPRLGESCARGTGHVGRHRSARSEAAMRATDKRRRAA